MAANLRSRINAGRGLSTPAALRQSVRCGSPYVANWPDGLGWRIVLRDVCMSGPIRAGHQSHSSSARKGGQSRSNGHNHYHPTKLDVAELDTFRNTTVRSQLVAHGIVQISVSDRGRGLLPSKVDQLFETFFTPKAQGTGRQLIFRRMFLLRRFHRRRPLDGINDGNRLYR